MNSKPANLVQIDAIDPNTGEPLASIVNGSYLTPPQIANAYGLPSSFGYGVKIGIISPGGGGFLQSDLNRSFADLQVAGYISADMSPPTIKKKTFDGASGTFNAADGASGENTVDIYCTATMAPLADITIYIGNTWESPINQAIADGCHIISISWSTNESTDFLQTQLATANTNKQAIVIASGDHGSAWYSGASTLSVGYPGSSPYIISIGGTKLALNSLDNRVSESDDNRDSSFGSTWGGGGGLSTLFTLPSYQTGLKYTPITNGVTGSPTNLTVRGIPDISAPMNVYGCYFNGSIGGFGGTSLAAPVIAGMLARFQQLTGIQRSSVEYNTLFYNNPSAFYDITTGTNNDVITSGYAGTSGWDCVTGLGPPTGSKLYPLLRPQVSFPKHNYGLRPTTGSVYPRKTINLRNTGKIVSFSYTVAPNTTSPSHTSSVTYTVTSNYNSYSTIYYAMILFNGASQVNLSTANTYFASGATSGTLTFSGTQVILAASFSASMPANIRIVFSIYSEVTLQNLLAQDSQVLTT